MVHLRRGLGLAGGHDDGRAGPGRPGAARGRDRGPQVVNYALFDDAGTALLGRVYIDPPEKTGADAEISWWVVDDRVGTELEQAPAALVPRWIAQAWPFERPRYVGRDLSWQEWPALPDLA